MKVRDVAKKIISIIILTIIFWYGYYLNQYVLNQDNISHPGDFEMRLLNLFVFVIIVSFLYHFVCEAVFHFSNNKEYTLQLVTFYVIDFLIWNVFGYLTYKTPGINEDVLDGGVIALYGMQQIYCIMIALCFGICTVVVWWFKKHVL